MYELQLVLNKKFVNCPVGYEAPEKTQKPAQKEDREDREDREGSRDESADDQGPESDKGDKKSAEKAPRKAAKQAPKKAAEQKAHPKAAETVPTQSQSITEASQSTQSTAQSTAQNAKTALVETYKTGDDDEGDGTATGTATATASTAHVWAGTDAANMLLELSSSLELGSDDMDLLSPEQMDWYQGHPGAEDKDAPGEHLSVRQWWGIPSVPIGEETCPMLPGPYLREEFIDAIRELPDPPPDLTPEENLALSPDERAAKTKRKNFVRERYRAFLAEFGTHYILSLIHI